MAKVQKKVIKKRRDKKNVEEMTAILQEMQEEANEYDRQRSAWYWEQLEQHYSGLSTIAEFQNETVENYRKLHSDFYIGDLIHRVENLEKLLDFFNVNNAMLQQFKAWAKNRVPAGWKYWEVTYKDSQWQLIRTRTSMRPLRKRQVKCARRCTSSVTTLSTS